jgi:zinc protease
MNTKRMIVLLAAAGFFLLSLTAGWTRGRKEQYPEPGDTSAMRMESHVPVDPAVEKGTFENGLTYYIRENSKPEGRAELRLVVNAGSILEREEQQGLAHFVEHMAFNGTENFSKDAILDYLEGVGMRFGPDINAYTSFDETVYKLQIPTEDPKTVEKGIKILSEWAFRIAFEEEEIEKERGVIIEEWRLGRGARARLREQYFPVLFKGSRYAERLPIGKKEIIENCDDEKLIQFYRDWYRPELMAVVAVGDFDGDEMFSLLEKHFSGVEGPKEPKKRIEYPVPDHDKTLYSVATDPEATSTMTQLYIKHDPRTRGTVVDYRSMLVDYIYNIMLNERLDELRRQPDPPFLQAGSSYSDLVRTKSAYALGAVVEQDGVKQGLETILTEAERVKTYGFTEGELERAKEVLFSSYERSYEERTKTESVRFAGEYVRNYLEGEVIPGIEYEFELYKRYAPTISLEEVNRRAEELITDKNRVVLLTGPEDGLPGASELAAVFEEVKSRDVEPYVDTVSADPLFQKIVTPGEVVSERTFSSFGVTEWVLSNGAKIVLKPTTFKNREILFEGFSPGGTSLVPDDSYVSAMMVPYIINASGVGSFSAVELQKKLAGKQVSLSPGIGQISEGFTGNAAPADLETLLQLLHLYMTEPREDRDAFSSLMTRIEGSIANRRSQPEAVFADTFLEMTTGNHFRTRPLTPELLEEVDLSKAMEVYRERFGNAGDFTFIFVGNFSLKQIKPLIERYIATLPSTGERETWKDREIRFPEATEKETIYRGIEPKSMVALGLGGDFNWSFGSRYVFDSLLQLAEIRLRETIREEASGTYNVGVYGYAQPYPREAYKVQISFGCEPERAPELTDLLFRELEKIIEEPPEDKNVEKVREQQRSWHEQAREKNGFWAGSLEEAYLYGLPLETVFSHSELIEQTGKEELHRMAREVFSLEKYVLLTLYPKEMEDTETE